MPSVAQLSGWTSKPMSRAPDNPVAMASTQPFIDCRLEPVLPSDPLEALAVKAARRPPEPSACGTAPRPLSASPLAVHRQGLIIRDLGQRLYGWLVLITDGQPVASERACRAIVAELLQQARALRREQADGE